MFENILIPTDGSEQADYAAEKAIELASIHDATVHVLYVVEPIYTDSAAAGQVFDALRGQGETIVEELAERAEAEDLTVLTAVKEGGPHSTILEYLEDNDIDLVVMGTHGRTGLDRYLLGSVTEKVVRLADIPVLTVQANQNETE